MSCFVDVFQAASKASIEFHSGIFPSTVKVSGFFAPLNCFGQQEAINNAAVEIKTAAEKAATAADQTFLVKPVNIPMPQALNSSRLLVVHNDAAAKAAAHLLLAYKTLKTLRTVGPDGLSLSGLNEGHILFATTVSKQRDRLSLFSEFIYCDEYN